MSKSSSKNGGPAPVSVRLNSAEIEALRRRAGGTGQGGGRDDFTLYLAIDIPLGVYRDYGLAC